MLRKLYNTARVSSSIGYVAGTATAASEAFNMPAVGKLKAVLPYWAVTHSFLELILITLNMLETQKKHRRQNDSYGERLESLLLDGATLYGSYQMFANGKIALATGSVLPVYNALAIAAGINFCRALYNFAKAEMKINNRCKLYQCTRDQLRNDDPKLFATRNLALRWLVSSAITGLGWTCLAVGHPAAVVLLGVMTLSRLYHLQKDYGPNLFSLFHHDTKVYKPKSPTVRPAMGFSSK